MGEAGSEHALEESCEMRKNRSCGRSILLRDVYMAGIVVKWRRVLKSRYHANTKFEDFAICIRFTSLHQPYRRGCDTRFPRRPIEMIAMSWYDRRGMYIRRCKDFFTPEQIKLMRSL